MPVRFCGLNPSIWRVTSYLATGSLGNEYSPWPSVTVLSIVPRTVLVAVTVTPGTTPPVGSLTVPLILPPTWANEGAESEKMARGAKKKHKKETRVAANRFIAARYHAGSGIEAVRPVKERSVTWSVTVNPAEYWLK